MTPRARDGRPQAAGVVVDGQPVSGARALALIRWVAAHAAELERIPFGRVWFHLGDDELKPGWSVDWPKLKTPGRRAGPAEGERRSGCDDGA